MCGSSAVPKTRDQFKDNITTIEGVAEMIQRTMASKEDIKDVREDIANVNGRLDRIEPLLLR